MPEDQNPATETPEPTERESMVEILTQGIARVGWDLRFQESALNLANKLADAVEAIHAENEG